MHHYQAYGECLASELPFPELREASVSPPRWTFQTRPEAALSPSPAGELLGAQEIYPACHARLRREGPDLSISVDDTGRYLLADGGRSITFWPVPGATDDYMRAHLLGRVLATAMHFDGALVLHGSAVAYPAGAVLFLAPKHSGKSTLALALTVSGARLISDDTIAVTNLDAERPLVRPGIHSLRLFPDSAGRLLGRAEGPQRDDGKQLVSSLPPQQREEETVPLAAVYFLVPAESIAGGVAIGRRPLPQPVAAAAMVGQGKISEMLGLSQAPLLLRRAARVASRVPAWQLAVHRDLSRLPEVVAQVGAWHGAGAGVP